MGDYELYSKKSLIANFWHFLKWFFLIVFKRFSLCWMEDKLYSRNESHHFYPFLSGIVWSFLWKTACARSGIMSYIVEFPPLQINANVFQHFCRDYLVILRNISLCRMGDNDLYKLPHCKLMQQYSGTFCSGFILSYPVQDGENELYSSISPLNWLYSNLSPRQLVVW